MSAFCNPQNSFYKHYYLTLTDKRPFFFGPSDIYYICTISSFRWNKINNESIWWYGGGGYNNLKKRKLNNFLPSELGLGLSIFILPNSLFYIRLLLAEAIKNDGRLWGKNTEIIFPVFFNRIFFVTILLFHSLFQSLLFCVPQIPL